MHLSFLFFDVLCPVWLFLAWKPTQMLQCIAAVDPVIRDDCVHACPYIYDPICARTTTTNTAVSTGSAGDGTEDEEYFQIFGNRCIFGMENCLASGSKFLGVFVVKAYLFVLTCNFPITSIFIFLSYITEKDERKPLI